MERQSKPAITPGLIFGVLIVAAGVVLLLDRTGILEAGNLWRFWPMALVFLGLTKFFQARESSGRVWGGLLALAGAVFQLSTLGYLGIGVGQLWPVALIAAGLALSWHSLRRGKPGSEGAQAAISSLNHWAAFGGGTIQSSTPDFQGGEVMAVFGGYEVDLRQAGIAGAEAVIDATAIFGGIEIKVPTDWDVTSQGVALLGAYEDKTRTAGRAGQQAAKRLIVRGFAIFGGVEIKN